MKKESFTSLSIPVHVVEKLREIGNALTPKSSLAQIAAHILTEAADYITAEGDLPELKFLLQTRTRLGKATIAPLPPAQEEDPLIAKLIRRIEALENADRLRSYGAQSLESLRAAEETPKRPRRKSN